LYAAFGLTLIRRSSPTRKPGAVLAVFSVVLARPAIMAATQRPVAESAFSESSNAAAWKRLPSFAIVATADKAAGTDLTRSMAQRAGATITELDGSHVVMVSRPQSVTDVILEAAGVAPSEHTWGDVLVESYLEE